MTYYLFWHENEITHNSAKETRFEFEHISVYFLGR